MLKNIRKYMRYLLLIMCFSLLSGCSKKEQPQSQQPDIINNQVHSEMPDRNIILEILDRTAFRDAMPEAIQISFDRYTQIKEEYALKNKNYRPGYAIVYEERDGDSSRGFWLTPESFDDNSVWIAELTQYKSHGWDWIARYKVERNLEVDEEFQIQEILEERSTVIGGVKYGMNITDVIEQKGDHYKISNAGPELGSAGLMYDDVTIGVRMYGTPIGRVVSVKPTTEQIKESMKSIPYEDEK